MPPILPLPSNIKPARLVQSAWIEHGPFAFWIIEALRPRLVVELGSYSGYSFCCFCEQMKRSGVKGHAIAIDTWRGDEHSGNYDDAVFDNLSQYVGQHHADTAEMKRMYFADALPSVADGSVDLLHVDGRHFYDDVVEDFTSWIPKLSDRAVVLFHDTQVRERGFGVYKYWAELEQKYPSFEFHHGHGLGVLGFGKNIPVAVMALFAQKADSAEAAATREAFAKRGKAVKTAWRRKRSLTRAVAKLSGLLSSITGGTQRAR